MARGKKLGLGGKQQEAYNKILSRVDEMVKEAVRGGVEQGAEEGAKNANIEDNIVANLTKKVSKKIKVPVNVELQPNIKINDKKLASAQIDQFNKIKDKKRVLTYFTDKATAKNNLDAAFSLHESHLSKGKDPNSNVIKSDIGAIVRWGNAYQALGGSIDELDEKLKKLYLDNAKAQNFNSKTYPFTVDKFKDAFNIIQGMLDNGFDMSSLRSNLVNAATDIAIEAVDKVTKTVKDKTKVKKIDNTDKIKSIQEELNQEEARYDELKKKKAEITKRRNEKQNEVIDDILNQQEKNLTNQLKKRDNERSKAFKARMDEEDFYYTDKKGNKKKITSFKTGNKTADRVYYERKANNASLDYWQTVVMNTPVEDKARSKQLAEQYKLKEAKKIQQNEKEYYDNIRKQIQYRTGYISNGKWGQEITKFFSSEIGENLDAMTHAINFDDLKVYKGYTEKQATQFYEFIHLLEQFCINAGSSFKGFEDTVDSIDIKSLFWKFLDAFKGFPEITKQYDLKGFTDFVNQMSGMVKESGLKKDGTFNEKKFQKFTDKYGTDDIKTRFLKTLGYQGYDLSRTSYGKLLDGTVLFDEAREKNIISSSDMIDELDKNVENFVSERVREIIQAAISEIDKKYQNYKAPVYYNQEQIENIKEAQRTKKKAIDVNSRKADQNLEQFIDKSYNVTGDELTASKNMLTIIGKLKYIFEKQNKEMPADVQSLFEELIGQFIDFSEGKSVKTDRPQMWKSDIKTKLKELYDSRESLTADQINEAFGLQNTKGDIKLQERIFNTLLGEKTTMEDLASLSEIIYSNEKKRSQITEDNSKKKNESKELVDQGYNAEKSAIDSKISKKIDAPFKKEFKDVDKDLEATRKNIVEKRKELLEAEFEQLSSSIEPQMTQEELNPIWAKIYEIQSKAMEYGLDSGRNNIFDRVDSFKKSLETEVEIVEKKAEKLHEAVKDYNNAKSDIDDVNNNKQLIQDNTSSKDELNIPQSTEGIDDETSAMNTLEQQATNTAKAKEGFAEANARVLSSIIESLKGLKDEGDLFKNLNLAIEKLSDSDNVINVTGNLKNLRDILNSHIDDDSFINSLKELISSGDTLKDLARVLSVNKKRLDDAKNTVQDIDSNKEVPESDIESTIEQKNELAITNQKVADSSDNVSSSAQKETEVLHDLSNSVVSNMNFEEFANTDLRTPIIPYIDDASDKLPIVAGNMKDIAEESVEVVDSLDKIAVAFDNNTSSVNENKNAMEDAIDGFSKYVTSTRLDVSMDADGHIREHSRSYKTQDRVGTKSQYTRTPEYDDEGNPTGRYNQIANQQVDYTAIVKQASKALIDQAEIEHKIDIEHQKSNGDLRVLGELYIQLTDAARRYSEALEVARDIHRDYMEYINDTSEGTKYQLDNYFYDRVAQESIVPLSRMEEQYRRQSVNKTNSYKKRIDSASNAVQYELDYGKHTESFNDELRILLSELRAFDAIQVFDESNIESAESALNKYKEYNKLGKLSANKLANENSVSKGLSQINSILSDNTKISFKRTGVYKDLILLQNEFQNFDTSKPQEELSKLMSKLLATRADFEELSNTIKGKNFFETFIERLRGANAQLIAQYLSFQDIIRYARTLTTTIIDLDTALVDLRKTTSMNTQELNEFYRASTDIGKQLGVTSQQIIQQAADWSRLGYSTKEQAETMAELSSMFASVSPGMSTEQSTDYLVSTMKAFGIETDEVERKIMDNVNRIGKILPKHMVTYGAKLLA